MIKPSQPETHPISHRWTIDAFTHKMAQQNRHFSSSTFTSSPTSTSSLSSSPHFKLRVYPNGPTDDLKDYLSVGLGLLSIGEQQKLLVLCQVSLIDIEGQNQNTKERLCYFFSEKICCVIGKFINKINLLDSTSQFVRDDKLTIDCQITILGEPSPAGFPACLPFLNSIAESKPSLIVKLFRELARRYQKNELPDFVPLDLSSSHNLLEETMTHHHEMSLSSSTESLNNFQSSDPTVVVEMPSFSVEPQLETVAVDVICPTSVQSNLYAKSKNSIPHAVQIVLWIFFLNFIIYLFMTGFSCRWSASENVAQSERMSDAFLQALRINSANAQFSLNLEQAKSYCLPATGLTDCKLDWPKLRYEMDSSVHYMNLSFVNSDLECYISNYIFTCFGKFDGTHFKVVLMPKTNWNHSAEINIFARHILAIDPYRYLLVTGNKAELQFCWIHLHGHGSCLNQ